MSVRLSDDLCRFFCSWLQHSTDSSTTAKAVKVGLFLISSFVFTISAPFTGALLSSRPQRRRNPERGNDRAPSLSNSAAFRKAKLGWRVFVFPSFLFSSQYARIDYSGESLREVPSCRRRNWELALAGGEAQSYLFSLHLGYGETGDVALKWNEVRSSSGN